MNCIICKANETEGNNEYCRTCFSATIEDLDRQYKERAPDTREDDQEALASEPLVENTYR